VPKFYITTAIDYSNGDPHLGHALEKVGADASARYRRMRGDQVHFLMGMDEHSQSVMQAAAGGGVTPQVWVERMATRFERFWQALHCSHDDWIRTTEPRHVRAVTELLTRIQQRNPDDLFVAEYEGLYCTGCEEFKTGAQIVDGRCIEHPTLTLVTTRERNHFFRLSRYRDVLTEMITSRKFIVEPAIRRNEILKLLEAGLQDISISRQRLPWGIPFPGDSEQTVYVWFDALINYLSATGFPDPGYRKLWPADLHIIGKGISRFHCVIWPAMLLAAGVETPREVWAHGYVQWGGAKMSKTAGTAVDLASAIERYGADPLRYFLLREVGFTNDGDFTWERFDERYNADLADGLGNLASRSLQMIVKYRDGKVPAPGQPTSLDQAGDDAVRRYGDAMDALEIRTGAEVAWDLVTSANQYIVQTAPWTLAKRGEMQELDQVLGSLARCLERLAILSFPFMPEKAGLLWQSLGAVNSLDHVRWGRVQTPAPEGQVVRKPENLFPKPQTSHPTT
jgi:methionyl-tRNA synthetase